MSKKSIVWTVVVVVIVALVALPKLLTEKKPQGGAPSGKGGGRGGPVAVTVLVLAPQSLSEKIVAPGSIVASDAVTLKSESAGRLVSLSIREGGRVAKGTLLAKINDADVQAQLLKANASPKLARDREARQKGLLDKQVISSEDYESATRDLESAKADSALLRAQIDKTEIRAPFDGIVGLKYVSQGAYLSPGTEITTLVNDRPLKIDFSVPEKYASRVKVGDKVSFTTSGGSSRGSGKVYAIDPMIDENTRSAHLRAVCENPDKSVVPGAFAEVTLIMGENPAALMVPSPSLVPDATGQKVYCVKEGAAVAKPVTTGVRDSTMVEITSGLQPGDSVITTGVLLLKPGAAVIAGGAGKRRRE